MNRKSPKSKVDDRAMITNYNNIFSKGYIKKWSKQIFVIDYVMKN